MGRRPQPVERAVRSPDGADVVVTATRSGVVDWDHGGGGSGGSGWDLLLTPTLMLGNVVTHRLVFRGGWTVHVLRDGSTVAKVRYRDHRTACEHLERLADGIASGGAVSR